MSAPSTGERDKASDVAAWLETGGPLGTDVRRTDTHAASLFFAADKAWKLKRPVRLDYLDFSTPDRRRAALEAELRLNRRTAPTLYLGLHAITRDDRGALALDGAGETVDWVLEMRRFPDDALLDRLADKGRLDAAMMVVLADRIAAFHAQAEIANRADAAARLRTVAEGNAARMKAFPDTLDPERVRLACERIDAAIAAQAALLDDRGQSGRVRRIHGDLHLANIALIDDVPTPFDCLEFDEELATADILYDLAFLLMDLWHRGLFDRANLLFNRYLDRSAIDEPGVGLLPLFMAIRATVRAHVLATQAAHVKDDAELDARAAAYLDLAVQLLEPVRPRLITIGGLSGTGKSSVARALAGHVAPAPGARILRSDVLRKRLAGVAPETRLPASAYSRRQTGKVYADLAALARTALHAGASVIADAMFARTDERTAIRAAAAGTSAGFDGLWLELDDEERIRRVEARSNDASDADAAIARAQSGLSIERPADWTVLAADHPVADVAAAARRVLRPG